MSYSDDLKANSSGIIKIGVPLYSGDGKEYKFVVGILQDDPQIQFGNNWSPISELDTALDPLQDFQQVIKTESISNYVSASGMAWKGTNHIKVNVSFYLISFNKNSNIRGQAGLLSSLLTMKSTGDTKVRVHGGYQLNLFANNQTLSCQDMSDVLGMEGTGGMGMKGTATLTFNSGAHTFIKGLLAQSLQIQPSTVSVKGGAPLYYNVNMSFTGYRAPITTDLEAIYGYKA